MPAMIEAGLGLSEFGGAVRAHRAAGVQVRVDQRRQGRRAFERPGRATGAARAAIVEVGAEARGDDQFVDDDDRGSPPEAQSRWRAVPPARRACEPMRNPAAQLCGPVRCTSRRSRRPQGAARCELVVASPPPKAFDQPVAAQQPDDLSSRRLLSETREVDQRADRRVTGAEHGDAAAGDSGRARGRVHQACHRRCGAPRRAPSRRQHASVRRARTGIRACPRCPEASMTAHRRGCASYLRRCGCEPLIDEGTLLTARRVRTLSVPARADRRPPRLSSPQGRRRSAL